MPDKFVIEVEVTAEGATAQIRSADGALKSMDKTAGSVENKFMAINRQLNTMFNKIGAVGRKMTLMGTVGMAGIAGMLAYGLKFSDELNTMNAQMAPLVGGLERAQGLTKNLAELATEGPFDLIDIMNLGRGLTLTNEYFHEWGQLKDTVLLFEDLASVASGMTGLGLDEALRMTQDNLIRFIASGGKQMGRIAMMLPMGVTPEGVPVWEQIKKEAEKAGGAPGAIISAIKRYMPEAWKGQAKIMEETFAAKWSNLIGKFKIALAEKLMPLLDRILGFLDRMAEAGALDSIADIFGDIAGYVADALEYIGPFVLHVLEFVKRSPLIKKILTMIIALGPAFLIVGGIILQIVGAVGGIITSFALMAAVGASFGTALAIVGSVILYIIQIISVMVMAVHGAYLAFKSMSDKSRERLGKLVDFVKFLGFVTKEVFKAIGEYVKPIIVDIGKVFAETFGNMVKVTIWVFEKIMEYLKWTLEVYDDISEKLGKGRPFEELMRKWDIVKKQREMRERGQAGVYVGWYGEQKKTKGGFAPGDLAPAPAGGGGGGGGGGTRGAARAITLYQTIEKLIIENVKSVDADSLRDAVGVVIRTEADTLD